jgi:hypothetical protein
MRNEREWPARTYRFVQLTGKKYAYSTWAPQFAERLKLSSTESNLIVCHPDAFSRQLLTRQQGSFGNFGMYIPAILVGIVVDSKGPRLGVAFGAVLLGIGYAAIYSGSSRRTGLG